MGDQVLAEDPSTGKVEAEPVQAAIDDGTKPLMTVMLSDESILAVTTNHPFSVDASSVRPQPGWVAAGDLQLGDHLRTASGQDVTITRLQCGQGTAHVYTLTIAHDHTFFVGHAMVLVHNTNCFDIITYSNTATGFEKHHGVLDVWAQANIPNYARRQAPVIVLTPAQHAATKAVFRDWLMARTGRPVGGYVDWKTVSPRDAFDLTDSMFNAAGVPQESRQEYYLYFHKYIYGNQ